MGRSQIQLMPHPNNVLGVEPCAVLGGHSIAYFARDEVMGELYFHICKLLVINGILEVADDAHFSEAVDAIIYDAGFYAFVIFELAFYGVDFYGLFGACICDHSEKDIDGDIFFFYVLGGEFAV